MKKFFNKKLATIIGTLSASLLSFSITDDPNGTIPIAKNSMFYKMYTRMFSGDFTNGLIYIVVGVTVFAMLFSIFKSLENPSPITIITTLVTFVLMIMLAVQGKKILYFAGAEVGKQSVVQIQKTSDIPKLFEIK